MQAKAMSKKRGKSSLLLRPGRDLPLGNIIIQHQVLLRATLEEPTRSVELLFCPDLS
jgi:hypothetical protein